MDTLCLHRPQLLHARKQLNSGFCAICPSQPVVCEKIKKAVTYYPFGNTGRCTALNNHHSVSFVYRMAARPVFRVKNQCFRILSFQDVANKADPNEGEDPESETQISLSSECRGMKETEQSSKNLRGFTGWFNKLQKPNFILQADEILQEPLSRLKSQGGHQMVKQLQEDQLSHRILKLWQSLDVYVKLSFAIFFPSFLAITVRFGIEASSELLPLWIIGPILMVTYIKTWLFVFHLCVKFATYVAARCMEAVYKFILFPLWFLQTFETKRGELVRDMRSGKYKELLREKLKAYQVRLLDAYLDFIEHWWPLYRRTRRFLKKVF